ncbi:DinB family protein [Glycomyces sp. YM15]|uniref:DinB family protein n=1 Tax=Glycomyces sp. YM15 TaxID=2800446 RepID=UPI0019652E75|nr:DinB family protein [Glycomyces sp. YM15]
MIATFDHTADFKGARFASVDLSGAVLRDCDVSDVKISGSAITNFRINGHAGELERVVVNDVDVTAFVNAELDRRHPERITLREVRSLQDLRAMWTLLESLWESTVARAMRLPEAALHERVDEEWSFVETLRHLVFATDVWIGRMLRGEKRPYHRLGMPTGDYPADRAVEIGVDTAARPSLAEVLEVRADRAAQVRAALADATEASLEETRTGEPAPGWGPETVAVATCFRVVLNEHCEHRQYALRDLAVLEAR